MLRKMLSRHEGWKNKPYRCTANKLTIGVGHNIEAKGLPDDIRAFLDENGYITDEMINRLLDVDIADATKDAKRLYPGLDSFTDARKAALIDFLFVGYGTAKKFINTNRAINEGRWEDAADGILKSLYARQVGNRAKEIAKMLREG